VDTLVSVDFFTVPTVFFHVLFVFVVLAHDRRRILSVNVTSNPSAAWTANQIVQAFPWESAPRYLLRDRDSIYGAAFPHRVRNLGIKASRGGGGWNPSNRRRGQRLGAGVVATCCNSPGTEGWCRSAGWRPGP
jgi:hypothetical protein